MFRNSAGSTQILQLLWHAILPGFCLLALAVPPASSAPKPKIRAITAFIRLDTSQYKQQVVDASTMLHNAKARFELAGYAVQSIRIYKNDFPAGNSRFVS
jgi:hypothetical protein